LGTDQPAKEMGVAGQSRDEGRRSNFKMSRGKADYGTQKKKKPTLLGKRRRGKEHFFSSRDSRGGGVGKSLGPGIGGGRGKN